MPDSKSAWIRWTAAGAAVVLILLAAGFVGASIGGDDSDSDSAPDTVAGSSSSAALLDSFSTSRGRLGLWQAETGQPWRQVGQRWVVDEGMAVGRGRDGATVTTVDTGDPMTFIQVVVGPLVAGSGILFRFEDVDNYWGLLAAPAVGRWNLVKVLDGEVTVVDSFQGLLDPGTLVVLRQDGDRMIIEINGTAVGQTSDAALADQAGVGFVVPAEGRAEFDQIIGSTGQISSVPATTAPATPDDSSPTSTTDDTESSPTSTTDGT